MLKMQSVLFPESRNIYKNNIINKLLSKRRAIKSSPFSILLFSRFFRSKRPVMCFVTITNCRIKNSQITEKHRTVYSFPTMRVFISAESYIIRSLNKSSHTILISASRYYGQRVLYYYTFYTEFLPLRHKKYNDFCIFEYSG